MIPAAEARVETAAGNSRFIATIGPAFTTDEAKAFIARIKAEFADATHNVPAYVIGHGQTTIAHCHDDGEPSGTAGRPMLAVLQGSGLGDVVVVITRYFGGTKLGTGGLVRAYGDAVRDVLRGVKPAVLLATTTLNFVLPYRLYDQALKLIEACDGKILDTGFLEEITVNARFKDEQVAAFCGQLGNLSAGQVEPVVVERNPETVFPLS